MATENRISQVVSDADRTTIDTAIKTIRTVLKPYLLTISTAERQQLPKMSDRSVPFVTKVLDYAQSHPEFAPSYLDVAELKKDVDLFNILNRFHQNLAELAEELTDTTMVAGSEAFVASLGYYNTTKQGAKQNVPNAKTVYDDLRVRFEDNGPKAAKPAK
jgi:hypothetical protein